MPVSSKDNELIYFDYAATAPFDMRLRDDILNSSWANANSLHSMGQEARRQLDDARRKLSYELGARRPSEIIFTSCATESCNTVFEGAITHKMTHVLISEIEHPAVTRAANALKEKGIKVATIAPSCEGIVEASALDEKLCALESAGANVGIVAIQMVNNIIGTIQPYKELAKVAHNHGALFMCDSVQALGKIEIDLENSGIDFASFSGHKIGAPKGIGALYIRTGVHCNPLLRGGKQEMGLRSGTQNVAGAVAFAHAAELANAECKHSSDHLGFIRKMLLAKLKMIDLPHNLKPVISEDVAHVPHILSLICDGLEGETLVLRFDNAGFAISSGSACSTASLAPNPVLTAMGFSEDEAYNSIRLSFGKDTTAKQVDKLFEVLPEVLS